LLIRKAVVSDAAVLSRLNEEYFHILSYSSISRMAFGSAAITIAITPIAARKWLSLFHWISTRNNPIEWENPGELSNRANHDVV
jgi:hypothetical protein